MLTQGEVQTLPALDYTFAEAWESQPSETPPGAWETPWGVDLFMVYPTPRVNSPHGLIDAEAAVTHPSYTKLDVEIREALPSDAFVYVPKYRPPSSTTTPEAAPPVTDDLIRAFEAYLGNPNRGRAIMLVGVGETDQQITPLLARLSQEDLRNRFAGLVHFSTREGLETDAAFSELQCSPALEGACYQSVLMESSRPLGDHLLPRLPNLRAEYSVLDPDGTAVAIAVQQSAVSIWLDTNAPKPAEPLFGFEAIEIAPIYTPNGEELDQTPPEQ